MVVIDPAARTDEDHVDWETFVARGREHRAAHPDQIEARQRALDPDAPATILYTSGTTGNPKGVVLTHRSVVYEAISTLEAAGLEPGLRQVSYLPLAHIAERVLSLYGPQVAGAHSYRIGDPADLLATLGEVHPTAFFGVPRVWEKIKTGISAKLAADPNPDNVKMVEDSMAAGLAWVQAQEVGGVMTPEIRAMAQDAVDRANARLSRPEQVKSWELLSEEWTAESDELTPTMKLKRRVVNEKYADVVSVLYAADA